MNRKILVNVGPYETRAAILEDGKLCELMYEIKNDEKIVGCIYKGRVSNVVPGTQSAFVDIGIHKDAYLTLTGVENEDMEYQDIFKSPIQDILKVGQDVVLQILKEPTPNKGPRSTMTLSLPGRYLVFMPKLDHIGVSRKISMEKERERLRAIGKRLIPQGSGVVFRTAAEGLEEDMLKSDLDILLKMWKKVEERIANVPPRTLLHRDMPLPMKIARDFFTDEVEEMIIDSEEDYNSIVNDCEFLTPMQRASLELYKDSTPLFEKYGLEKEIERAFDRKIWLESGGYLFFDKTEAMYCIDVNSGRFSGGNGLEETVFKVNVEAAKEIARQIRLRNLSGVIIIDFIDMESPAHRAQVLKALKDGFRGDKNKPHILDFSELGLVQMTRRRTSASLDELRKTPCPCCHGTSKTLSVRTIANALKTQLLSDINHYDTNEFIVHTHKSVGDMLKTKNELKEIEEKTSRKVFLKTKDDMDLEFYSIEPVLSQDKQKELYKDLEPNQEFINEAEIQNENVELPKETENDEKEEIISIADNNETNSIQENENNSEKKSTQPVNKWLNKDKKQHFFNNKKQQYKNKKYNYKPNFNPKSNNKSNNKRFKKSKGR